jgi:hypothetical protein
LGHIEPASHSIAWTSNGPRFHSIAAGNAWPPLRAIDSDSNRDPLPAIESGDNETPMRPNVLKNDGPWKRAIGFENNAWSLHFVVFKAKARSVGPLISKTMARLDRPLSPATVRQVSRPLLEFQCWRCNLAATSLFPGQRAGRTLVKSPNGPTLFWPLIIKFPKTPPKPIHLLSTGAIQGPERFIVFSRSYAV